MVGGGDMMEGGGMMKHNSRKHYPLAIRCIRSISISGS